MNESLYRVAFVFAVDDKRELEVAGESPDDALFLAMVRLDEYSDSTGWLRHPLTIEIEKLNESPRFPAFFCIHTRQFLGFQPLCCQGDRAPLLLDSEEIEAMNKVLYRGIDRAAQAVKDGQGLAPKVPDVPLAACSILGCDHSVLVTKAYYWFKLESGGSIFSGPYCPVCADKSRDQVDRRASASDLEHYKIFKGAER